MASSIEDKVRAILDKQNAWNEKATVRKLVELVGDEKSLSYSLGFVDGERRLRATGRMF